MSAGSTQGRGAAATPRGASECGVCALHARAGGPPLLVWTDGTWLLRHHGHPAPMAGWFLLDSVRCVRNAADFTQSEAATFGAALQRVSRAVRDACNVPRTYTLMFGEGAPHLHAHIIPRDPADPSTCAWAVADLYRAVERGLRAPAAEGDVDAAVARVRSLLGRAHG